MKKNYRKHTSLKASEKLIITLRFYATGSFLITIGDFSGINKSTVSKTLKRVSAIIASLRNKYIYMPRNLFEQRETISTFYDIAKFPNVIGTIDCTHIKMQSPGEKHDNDVLIPYRKSKVFLSNWLKIPDYFDNFFYKYFDN
jgi:hypothetical protein